MTYVFASPYLPLDRPARWLRGNHHGHSVLSDGEDEPVEMLEAYEAAGYDYFALSEHDLFADPEAYRGQTAMTVLPAVEITSADEQTLMYLGATADIPPARTLSLPEIAAFVTGAGGLFIVDHPNWCHKPGRRHATVAEIMSAPTAQAIEIYTGVVERLPGSADALDVWDAVLSEGRRVFGHAVDDQHSAVDRFLGWNCVQWPAGQPVDAAGVIDALAAGRFVASTGVTVHRAGVAADGREIVIESDARQIKWFVRDGMLADVTDGGNGRFHLARIEELPRLTRPWRKHAAAAEAMYVRAEAVGDGGRHAWTQPFFIEAC